MVLSAMISNGAVFQRNKEIVVFGTGSGHFCAEFLGERKEITANGDFSLTFSPHKAGGPYEMKVWLDGKEKTIENIMIGEVLMLAGQSNATLTIAETESKTIKFEDNDKVRYFSNAEPRMDSDGKLVDPDTSTDKWHCLRSDNALQWSALALHIALNYVKKLDMAVGIVMCAHGAANIQSFLSRELNAKFSLDDEKLHPDSKVYKWNLPAYIYDWLVEKVISYNIDMAVWYQGESNRSLYESGYYAEMLKALIKMLRKESPNGNMPFVVVQINDFPGTCTYEGVTAIQNAQEKAVNELDNCRLVRISDMGQHDKIHPENKAQVAERICVALNELGL